MKFNLVLMQNIKQRCWCKILQTQYLQKGDLEQSHILFADLWILTECNGMMLGVNIKGHLGVSRSQLQNLQYHHPETFSS